MAKDESLLFITRKWPPAVGGMEIYSREMARELEKLCATKVLALPGRADGQPPGAAALVAFCLRCAWYLLRRVPEHDLVLLGDLVLAPLALFARLGNRKVKTGVAIHGSDVAYHLRKGIGPKLYRGYLFFIRSIRPAIDAVIVNSVATGRQAARIGLAEANVIPLGVRLPEPAEIGVQRSNILFVGRIMPRKGAAWFAEKVLPGLPTDMNLLVAGTEWDDGEAGLLKRNSRVRLLGPVLGEQLRDLRASSVCVVVPNVPMRGRDFEGFGLVALEGAADGGVVLAADLDGLSSAIVDGQTGFLLPAEDAEAWRRKIREVLSWSDEQRAAFVAKARHVLARDFSWAAAAEKTLTVLRNSRGKDPQKS